jgi:hypothetical protein
MARKNRRRELPRKPGAALEAHLAGPARPLVPGQVAMMAPFEIWSIEPSDLEPGRPVHARCQPGGMGRLLRTIGFLGA